MFNSEPIKILYIKQFIIENVTDVKDIKEVTIIKEIKKDHEDYVLVKYQETDGNYYLVVLEKERMWYGELDFNYFTSVDLGRNGERGIIDTPIFCSEETDCFVMV